MKRKSCKYLTGKLLNRKTERFEIQSDKKTEKNPQVKQNTSYQENVYYK